MVIYLYVFGIKNHGEANHILKKKMIQNVKLGELRQRVNALVDSMKFVVDDYLKEL
ncbi:hypothetical protein [Anoxybacter fermentans]|uniref:hypothetical protein n=1 Tax=Anoxybacter fermentans TaxID=1323375 RepID=UPI0013E0CDB7|nr:hypothetical protein [Anoxybacter fermentans]